MLHFNHITFINNVRFYPKYVDIQDSNNQCVDPDHTPLIRVYTVCLSFRKYSNMEFLISEDRYGEELWCENIEDDGM